MQKFLSANQYAETLGVSKRRVQILCKNGRIKGALQLGEGPLAAWMIPTGAVDPRQAPGRKPGQKIQRHK